MKKEVMEKWVKALRSGEYKQTKCFLRDATGFCCLGVLCDLAKEDLKLEWTLDSESGYVFDSEPGLPPASVKQWAGLNDFDPAVVIDSSHSTLTFSTLALLNDEGYTFDQIADIIETQYESL